MSQLTADFFATILKMEGGYQNRPDDNGNYNSCGELAGTNMGVSAVALSTFYDRCVQAPEMKALSKEAAFDFYAWYFDYYRLYQVENQEFAQLLMNNTMGSPTGAAKSEQRALNRMGYSVSVDGNRGTQTIQALNDAWRKNPTGIYNTVREEWIKYLQSINKPQFMDGWMYRMNRFFPKKGFPTSGLQVDFLMLAIYAFAGYQLLKFAKA